MRFHLLTVFCLLSLLLASFQASHCAAAAAAAAASPNAALRHFKQQRQQTLQPTAAASPTSSASQPPLSDHDMPSSTSGRTKLSAEASQHLHRALFEMQYHACADAKHPFARLCVHHEQDLSHAHSFLQSGGQAGSQAHLDAQAQDIHNTILAATQFVQAQALIQGSYTRRFLDSFLQPRFGGNAPNHLTQLRINNGDFNYLIVGGGPGGLISALYAFSDGARSIEIWEKRGNYVLDQLVAAGFLPFESLRNLNTDSTLPWYSLGQKITNFFSDVSLKHVAFYLHACVQVLAGASANYLNSPYAAYANTITIRMDTKLLAFCRIGNNDPKYSAIGITGLPNDGNLFVDPFATDAEQNAYCNYIRDPTNNFINGAQWAVPANHAGANTALLQRLSAAPNGRGGFIARNLNLATFADGSRSRLRDAFFGPNVRRLWLRDNIPSTSALVNDAATFTGPAAGPDGSQYEYDVSFGVKSNHLNGNSVLWDWAKGVFVTPTQISCGSMAHRQHVPSVINAARTDFVLSDVSGKNWVEGATPLGNSQVLVNTVINLSAYTLTIGGVATTANFRNALINFGPPLAGKNAANNAHWVAVSLADLGVISVMSRRGQGLCNWNVRFKYPHAAHWKTFYDQHKQDASVRQFLAAFAQTAGTALFSDTLDWVNFNVDTDVSVFKSPIFYLPNPSQLWTNAQDHSGIQIALSLEGDAELPAYYVTGKGIESAASRAEQTTWALIRRAIVGINNANLNMGNLIAQRNGVNIEYSLRQACKYLSEMVYYKTGTVIALNTAKNLYTDPNCGNVAENWKCRCLTSNQILNTFLQENNIAFANI